MNGTVVIFVRTASSLTLALSIASASGCGESRADSGVEADQSADAADEATEPGESESSKSEANESVSSETTSDAGASNSESSDVGGSDSGAPVVDADRRPLYLIAASFEAGDQRETYFVTSRTFDSTTKIDPTDGPKLLGGIVPLVHDGAVFAPASTGPSLVRYDVGRDDKLVKGHELSFAGVGISEIASWNVYVVSSSKGYLFDPAGARMVVWDPSKMELTGREIDLSAIAKDGYSPNLDMEPSASPKLRGSQLVLPLSWYDQDGNSRHASGVVVLDVERDELLGVDEDERCGESFALIEGPDGDIYFFPPDWSSLPHYFSDDYGDTCILRVRAGQTEFDDDYVLNLSELGSGSAAAGAISDGGEGFFFTAVDPELWDDGSNLAGEFWRFWHYDFASGKSRRVTSLPPWSHNCYHVIVDGRAVLPRSEDTDDGKRTTVYAVDGAEDPKKVFSFNADWFGMATLR